MTFDEMIQQLRSEYWAGLAADPRYQDNYCPSILDTEDAPSFYDFLLSREYSRFQLSAHGIARDIEA